jgi:hypothetical protein
MNTSLLLDGPGITAARMAMLLSDTLRDLSASELAGANAAEHEMRAGAIAWVAAFIPEAVPRLIRHRLFDLLRSLEDTPSEDRPAAIGLPLLWAAAHGLEGGHRWLRRLTGPGMADRTELPEALLTALGLVAPRIACDDPAIVGLLGARLRRGGPGTAELLGVWLGCAGDRDQKLAVLKAAARLPRRLSGTDAEAIALAMAGAPLPIPGVTRDWQVIQAWVMLALAGQTLEPGEGDSIRRLFLAPGLPPGLLWQRVAQHPLTAGAGRLPL